MKTPNEIAHEAVNAVAQARNASDRTVSLIVTVAMRAIEADRAERDIYELIAEQLDDRVDIDGDGLEWGQRAKRAATAVRSGEHDDLWDRFIGPMLDRMEGGLS